MIHSKSRRNSVSLSGLTSRKTFVAHRRGVNRNGLTLAELLVATSITAMVVAALGVFTKAVMDGCEEASRTGTATQTGRVVTSRIAHKVATSRQVLKMSDAVRNQPGMDQVLLVWERDGEPGDTAPGQPNLVELVIYAPHKKIPMQLLELRPQVDPALVVPLDEPTQLNFWIERFRSGQDIATPTVVLLNDLGGVHFDVEEFSEPQGVGGVVQQNVRTVLCVSPPDTEPEVFFGSATRRYVINN